MLIKSAEYFRSRILIPGHLSVAGGRTLLMDVSTTSPRLLVPSGAVGFGCHISYRALGYAQHGIWWHLGLSGLAW